MRKCKKVYGRRLAKRRCARCRERKRVNKSIRRCHERRRKRWRRPRTYDELCEGLDSKEGEKTTDWRDRDTKRERTYNRSE